MAEKDPTHSPTPTGDTLSDYALGRDDVAEMNEKLRDLGYSAGESRNNPFSAEGAKHDPYVEKSEIIEDEEDQLESIAEVSDEEIQQNLTELQRLITLWQKDVSVDEDGGDVGDKIFELSQIFIGYGSAFKETEYYQRYREIKAPHDLAAKRERELREKRRAQQEIDRLRRGISG